MLRWRSTPAAKTHRRRRRGHTSTMKVASKARVDQVSRCSSDAPARSSQSGATKRCRSSMRSDHAMAVPSSHVVPRVFVHAESR